MGRADTEQDGEGAPGAEDIELVERAQAGDDAAFAELYARHVAGVRRVVGDNVRGADERADVVQETFTRVVARIGGLRNPAAFRGWLFAIARNAAIDHRRSRGRVRVDPIDEDEAPELSELSAGPEQQREAGEALEVVRCCLEALSERDRTALGLVAHLGLSPAEVGEVLGLTAGAAKVVVHRARARLRDAVVDIVVEQATSCDLLPGARAAGATVAREHVRHCVDCNEHLQDVLAPVLASVLVG